jgi:hypothetical protein
LVIFHVLAVDETNIRVFCIAKRQLLDIAEIWQYAIPSFEKEFLGSIV